MKALWNFEEPKKTLGNLVQTYKLIFNLGDGQKGLVELRLSGLLGDLFLTESVPLVFCLGIRITMSNHIKVNDT